MASTAAVSASTIIKKKLPVAALGLRDFMRRRTVIQQYRNFLRELHGIDDSVAKELRKQIQDGFAVNKHEKSAANVRSMIVEGTRQLQFLRTYVGTARKHSPSSSSSSPTATGSTTTTAATRDNGEAATNNMILDLAKRKLDGGNKNDDQDTCEEHQSGTGSGCNNPAHHHHTKDSPPTKRKAPIKSLAEIEVIVGNALADHNKKDPSGSWVGTGEKDDIRGRIGEGWPWR